MADHAKMRLLFVDDEPSILQLLECMIQSMEPDWQTVFVDSGESARQLLAQAPFDIVISDMRMAGINGVQLLNEVMQRYPATVRIILSGYADEETLMQCVGIAHQFLTKPFDLSLFRAALRRIFSVKARVRRSEIQSLAANPGCLPTMPAIYVQILQTLQSLDCSVESIAHVIRADPGLTAKLLQLVNSAFFGFARQVSSAEEAVMLLGVGRIRALAMAQQLFSTFKSVQFEEVSVEQIWHHSLRVGEWARRIVAMEGGNEMLLEQAFTAGLLHDIGKLILAQGLSSRYFELIAQAQRQQRSLVELELEHLHATHADVGAYLLEIWGLPTALVETVAFHHNPSQTTELTFSALTAVHVANAWEGQLDTLTAETALSCLDREYLTQLGVKERVPVWHEELKLAFECTRGEVLATSA